MMHLQRPNGTVECGQDNHSTAEITAVDCPVCLTRHTAILHASECANTLDEDFTEVDWNNFYPLRDCDSFRLELQDELGLDTDELVGSDELVHEYNDAFDEQVKSLLSKL